MVEWTKLHSPGLGDARYDRKMGLRGSSRATIISLQTTMSRSYSQIVEERTNGSQQGIM